MHQGQKRASSGTSSAYSSEVEMKPRLRPHAAQETSDGSIEPPATGSG